MNKIRSQLDLEEIFKDLNVQIYKYIYIRTGMNKELAEDLTQEVFLRVWKERESYKTKKASIKTWTYTIARNLVIDHYRKMKFEPMSYEDVESDENMEGDIIKNELQQYILEKMRLLKEDEKELILLYYIEQLSLKEIADITGKNYNAIKMAVNRALHKLKALCKI